MDSNTIPCNNFVIMIDLILQYCRENNIDHKDVVFFENTNATFGYRIGNKKWIIFWGSFYSQYLNVDYFNIRKLSFEDVVYIQSNRVNKEIIIKYFDKLHISVALNKPGLDEETKNYIRMFI